MADRNLDVLVRILTEQVGAQKASEILEEVRVASGKTALATDDLSEATKHSGEAAEHANIHHGETRRLFTEINRICPGLGEALHAAFSGPLGPIILLGIAIHEVQGKLKEYNDELDKQAEALSQPLDGGVLSVRDAWEQAAHRMGDYFAAMKTAGLDNDPEATALKNIKELTDARIEAAKKEVKAAGEVAEANAVARGASPAELARIKAQTEASIQALDAQKEHANGAALLQKELADRLADTQRLYAAVKNASDAAREADRRYNQDQATLKSVTETLAGESDQGKNLKKRREDAEAELEHAQNTPGIRYEAGPGGVLTPVEDPAAQAAAIAEARAKLDGIAAEVERLQKEKSRLEDSQVSRDIEHTEADEAAKLASKQATGNEARLRQLPGEVNQAEAVESIKSTGTKAAQVLQDAGRAITGDAAAMAGDLAEAKKQLAESQRVARELIAATRDTAIAHSDAIVGVKKALQDIAAANLALFRQISEMQSQQNAAK